MEEKKFNKFFFQRNGTLFGLLLGLILGVVYLNFGFYSTLCFGIMVIIFGFIGFCLENGMKSLMQIRRFFMRR